MQEQWQRQRQDFESFRDRRRATEKVRHTAKKAQPSLLHSGAAAPAATGAARAAPTSPVRLATPSVTHSAAVLPPRASWHPVHNDHLNVTCCDRAHAKRRISCGCAQRAGRSDSPCLHLGSLAASVPLGLTAHLLHGWEVTMRAVRKQEHTDALHSRESTFRLRSDPLQRSHGSSGA